MNNKAKANLFTAVQIFAALMYSFGVLYLINAPFYLWLIWFILQASVFLARYYLYKDFVENKNNN